MKKTINFLKGLFIFILCLSLHPIFAQQTNKIARPQSKAEMLKYKDKEESETFPTNKWAIKIAQEANIKHITKQLKAKNLGQIGQLKGFYQIQFDLNLLKVEEVEAIFKKHREIIWFQRQVGKKLSTFALPSDPLFQNQWHILNEGQAGGIAGIDMNIVPVWEGLSITGKGVQVGITDDGLQHTHPDLSGNYVPEDSYDFNNYDANPMPDSGFGHGTSVGGLIAAQANGLGVVGGAYNAKISGLRILGGQPTDADIAGTLNYAYQNNDIYNMSWGFASTIPFILLLYSMPPLTALAIEEGAQNGRGGLGNIYVKAVGNSGDAGDNANYEELNNSIYTIGVGAYGIDGEYASYSEPGACVLISAPSNSKSGLAQITTTDLMGTDGYSDGDYTDAFGGTSAATPNVSGVIALMLEANPNLGWRDVQHILVQSARIIDTNHPDWTVNGAGLPINHQYGFGAIDAKAAVELALNWSNRPDKVIVSDTIQVNQPIPDGGFSFFGPPIFGDPVISYVNVKDDIQIEHIEVVFNATHSYRGDLRIRLTSPNGTESILAEKRIGNFGANYSNWTFMSVRNWDESSAGIWKLTVDDGGFNNVGIFHDWSLIIHGTKSRDICDTQITELSTQVISTDSMKLVWAQAGDSTTNYEIHYKPTDSSTWIIDTTNQTFLGLSNLDPCNWYEAKVRTICANGSRSHFSKPTIFSGSSIIKNGSFESMDNWTINGVNSAQHVFCSYDSCGIYPLIEGENLLG